MIDMRMNATLYYRNKLDENDRAIYDVSVILLIWFLCSRKMLYKKWKRNGEERDGK